MRWVHIAIVVLFAAATLIFLVQNREIVSMDFLGFSVRAPARPDRGGVLSAGSHHGWQRLCAAQAIRAGGSCDGRTARTER